MSTTRHMAEVAARVGLYLPWCVSRLEPDIFDLVQLSSSLICWVVTYLILSTIPRKSRNHGEAANYGSFSGFRVCVKECWNVYFAYEKTHPTQRFQLSAWASVESWMAGAYMSGVDCRSNEIGLCHEGTKGGNGRIPVAQKCWKFRFAGRNAPFLSFFAFCGSSISM